MKIIDGVAYASVPVSELKVISVKPLSDMMMLLSFNNNEDRLFDVTTLLDMPAFEPLKNESVYKQCTISNGVVTWMNGEIDIAPETMYLNSFKYNAAGIM